MNSRITPAEAALLMPFSAGEPAEAQRIRAVVAEARRARDAALAAHILAGFRGLAALVTALRRRRETVAELKALSDRELADIGLTRGGIEGAAAAAAPLPANDPAEGRQAA